MYPVNHDILTGKVSVNAPRHHQRNKVSYLIRNLRDIPKREEGKKQIYLIYQDNKVIGVGESTHVPTRISGGYAWCIRTMKPDGSTIIKAMQQEACRVNDLGQEYHFEVEFVEQVEAKHARRVEADMINYLRSKGHPILNKTK